MGILDRYIIRRFLINFCVLFALMFLLSVSIDMILQADRFVGAVRARIGEDAGALSFLKMFAQVSLNFHGPRVFQFYAILHGLIIVGAMAFTLAQMYRQKELVAILAAGMSLYRVGVPFIIAAFALNVVQLLNQELIMPKLAPLLIRQHKDLNKMTVDSFEIKLTADGNGSMIHSTNFDPQTESMDDVTILVRDEGGALVQRISATQAMWNEERSGWMLVDGLLVSPEAAMLTSGQQRSDALAQPVQFFQTNLSPQVLTMHRFGDYVSMLGIVQINDMLSVLTDPDLRPKLLRARYSRLSLVLINMFSLMICLPFFLLREPAGLLKQSVTCALTAIPALLGGFIGMNITLPGLAPAVGVFMPAIVLLMCVPPRLLMIRT